MPNHWRPTRGRTGPRVDEGTSTGQAEPSRRHHQTPQHVEHTANPTVGSQDVEKLPSKISVSRTRTDMDRPRTAGGASQPISTTVERPPRGSSRAYTAEAQRPPARELNLKTAYYMDEEMIGMALGSPGHAPFAQANVHDNLYAAAADLGAQVHLEGMAEGRPINTKAGKWKKFGGLFKPKHNPSIPAATAVPQSSQPQRPGQKFDAPESKPIPLPKDPPKFSQTFPHPEPAEADSPPTEDFKDNNATMLRTQLPKLDVDIPDIQMDRYSVMFGSLLGGQQSASLLSRRSKVLERLKTTSDENVASEDPLPQPKQLDDAGLSTQVAESEYSEQLKPPQSSRRATSPTPGRSPVFSLFPQPATTPRRAAATTSQAKPTPLQRSFTAPSRLSPMEETFGTKKPHVVKPSYTKRRKSSISLVETSASTTQGPGWSTDGSCLSPTSSVSSVSDEILFDIKKLSMVTENQEPQYEVTKPDGEAVELYRARSQKNRAAKPPALKLLPKYSTAEASKPAAPEANESISSSSDATVKSIDEGANTIPVIIKPNPEYLLPSTHFVPTTRTFKAAKEPPAPESNQIRAQTFRVPADVKERSIPEASPPTVPVSDSPVEIDESAEASHDILAAAVMGTLDHMGEQSSLRAASPMPPDSPGFRVPTPEKPIKLLVIPKNIPISKYALRPSADSHIKADQISRSSSPQPQRAVTEPLVHDQSFSARATRLQAAPAIPIPAMKKTTAKSNSSSKIVPAQAKNNSKSRGPKPELSIVAPEPTAPVDTSHAALSPIEVTVARQVSLSRKQSKRLLITPVARRFEGLSEDNGEKVVNTQALMPVIVDAHKAHRPGKSLAVSIQNA
jgi:hypothetical protein